MSYLTKLFNLTIMFYPRMLECDTRTDLKLPWHWQVQPTRLAQPWPGRETMEEPVKGWLHKTRKGMMMKAAQRHRRWFVLEGTTLSWYVDDSETAETPDAKGSIDVRGATVETTKALKFNLEFATGRRDKLEAESQEDVNTWARVRARARAAGRALRARL